MAMSPATRTAADGDMGPGLRAAAHDHRGAQEGAHSALAEYPVPPPREILDAAGELLRALAAPVRIAIVLQLRESHRCVHELVDALGVPQPLISQHLKILKAAGVVAGERSGREVLYRLADHHLAHIVVDAVAHAGEDEA
jgi:DNA-binding transcriptional ArsR family regulator